ncbi:ParB-like protein [Paraburkholderia sp. SIMBA_054]|uniref:ParB-like protein n=1 Tax=Paraburkholderia sp. SIMBA_054 TaxID=3085795 RepID=UPI00397D7F35
MRLLTGRIPKSGLPESVGQADDVFQSPAAFIRTAGVFENPGEFNAKFAWADYFRQRISLRPSAVDGLAQMLAEAFTCSRLVEARALPGFMRERE